MYRISGFKGVSQNKAALGEDGNRVSALSAKAESMYSDRFRDYKHLSSGKELSVSEEEYKAKVSELAQSDMKRGVHQGSEFRSMQGKYVQVVSPDRENVVYNMINAMVRSQPPIGEPNVETHVYRKDNVVATYSPRDGWFSVETPEEKARAAEIADVYNRAWAQAYSEGGNVSNNTSKFSPYTNNGYIVGISLFSTTI